MMATVQPCEADEAYTGHRRKQVNCAESMRLQDFRSFTQGYELRLPDLAALDVVTVNRGNILEPWKQAA